MALLVGLTGSMGSGKSLAASMLHDLGAHIIDADEICRDLVRPDRPAWREIVERFGEDILLEDGSVDRAKLAHIVFADPERRSDLEAILHPKVFAEERKAFDEIRARDSAAVVAIDAALLIESGNYKNVDKVVVVGTGEETQIRRLLERGLWTREEIVKRIRSQMSLKEKMTKADYFIPNDSTVEDLRERIEILYRELKTLS